MLIVHYAVDLFHAHHTYLNKEILRCVFWSTSGIRAFSGSIHTWRNSVRYLISVSYSLALCQWWRAEFRAEWQTHSAHHHWRNAKLNNGPIFIGQDFVTCEQGLTDNCDIRKKKDVSKMVFLYQLMFMQWQMVFYSELICFMIEFWILIILIIGLLTSFQTLMESLKIHFDPQIPHETHR